MPKTVELRGISKKYLGKTVLEDVSLSLAQGKFHALLGINGAGKSTLMNILMRNELPDRGQGFLFGVPMDRDDPSLNAKIGYVSENILYNVPGSMRHFFEVFGELYPRWNSDTFFGLADQLRLDLNRSFMQYSRGQRMQVALAAALAIRPELLLLDEITAVLDPQVRTFFMGQLTRFVADGGTVLMATNIVTEIHGSADHLFLLHEGRLHFDAPMVEVSRQFKKVRKSQTASDPVFNDPSCRVVAVNSDGSCTYLIPRQVADHFAIAPGLEDRRGITAEEVFIYFTKEARGLR